MAECWYSESLKRQVTSSVKEQVPAWWYGNAGTLAQTLAFECYESHAQDEPSVCDDNEKKHSLSAQDEVKLSSLSLRKIYDSV